MAMTRESITRSLVKMLPPGVAMRRSPDSVMRKVLDAAAEEFARIYARAGDLLDETHLRGDGELLDEWERELGLPEPCMPDDATLDDRRNAVRSKRLQLGGQSVQYFIDVASGLGIVISISEQKPFRMGDRMGKRLYGETWAFAWVVHSTASPETTLARVGTARVGDRLRQFGADILQCVFDRLAPAHTVVIYSYGEQ